MIADGSGVVFLPSAHVDEVLGAAEQIAARKAAIAAAIRKGEPVSRVLEGQRKPGPGAGPLITRRA